MLCWCATVVRKTKIRICDGMRLWEDGNSDYCHSVHETKTAISGLHRNDLPVELLRAIFGGCDWLLQQELQNDRFWQSTDVTSSANEADRRTSTYSSRALPHCNVMVEPSGRAVNLDLATGLYTRDHATGSSNANG